MKKLNLCEGSHAGISFPLVSGPASVRGFLASERPTPFSAKTPGAPFSPGVFRFLTLAAPSIRVD